MSRKAKVLLVTEADSNVDFLEQGITSRYKLLDRGRTYSIGNAFKKIEEESPDVIIINSMFPLFSIQHDEFLRSIERLENYSPEIIFTYCIPKEKEEDGWIKENLEKLRHAGIEYVLNLIDCSLHQFADELRCIIEEGGRKPDMVEVDEETLEKEREELRRKLGEAELLDYIPSNSVKKYIKDNNITFTDFEKAALIFNAYNVPKEEIHTALKGIMKDTKDDNLKKQIAERLEEDEKILKIIQTGGDDAIYQLWAYEPEDEDYLDEGFYATFEAAKKFSAKFHHAYKIEKMKLLFGDEEDDGNYVNEDYISPLMGEVHYDEKGKIIFFYSNEYEENQLCEMFNYERFEVKYISFRHPFRQGDIVKNIANGERGVVRTFVDDADWEEYDDWNKKNSPSYSAFSDAQVVVEILLPNGEFSHDHIEPWLLEYDEMQSVEWRDICDKGNLEGEALILAGQLIKGEGSIELLQMVTEDLRKRYELHNRKY